MKFIRLGMAMFLPLLAINSSNKSFLAAEILPNSVKEQISIKSTLSLPNYFPTPIPPKVPEG